MTSKNNLLSLYGNRKSTKPRKGKTLTSYFTDKNVNSNECGGVSKEQYPFKIPSLTKFLPFETYNRTRYKENRVELFHSKVGSKNNSETKKMREFLERIHIVQPPSKLRTVLDVYPDFYNAVEGRPGRPTDDINVYKISIRNYTMLKQQIGYRRDILMHVGTSMADEQKVYQTTLKEYKQHLSNFQLYIFQSHQLAITKVHESETAQNALRAKQFELYSLHTELNTKYGHIFQLEEIRKTLKKYRNFLNEISPLSWRRMCEQQNKTENSDVVINGGSYNRFGLDIDEIIGLVLEELSCKQVETYIYFTKPEQLMDLFNYNELQCRNNIMHLTNLSTHVQPIKMALEILKQSLKVDETNFGRNIKALEKQILHDKEAAQVIRNSFFHLLNTTFFQCSVSQEVLKLQICVEHTFSEVFDKASINKSLLLVMKLIEQEYENLNSKLDTMDLKIANKAKEEYFRQDRQTMLAAARASRQLKSFHELNKTLRKSFLPPIKPRKVELSKFQQKIKPIKLMMSTPYGGDTLTTEERTNLILFTQWCSTDDPKTYLEQLRNQFFNLDH